MSTFNGKVALVTGAASGIGRSTAELYAREGAKVIISDVSKDGGEETVRLIRDAGGDAAFVQTDVSDAAACEALVQRTLDAYGRLDFACNNAGIGGEANPTGAYSIEDWQKVIGVNLSGIFYCMRYQIPAMLQEGGAIVNMASILGQVGFATAPAYVAAKHGLLGLTKTAAIEYAQQGIRINTVGPAFIRTPLIADLENNPEAYQMLLSMHPIGRLGEPAEVAELVIWLSSDRASFVTGAYYPVDGGYLAR
ncbi:MAG TPA: SDR family oxidoreductase [Rhodothermales bacterium]|nr:SDR family oxidoreductase [Rhodothermales bacterium]